MCGKWENPLTIAITALQTHNYKCGEFVGNTQHIRRIVMKSKSIKMRMVHNNAKINGKSRLFKN